MLNERWRSHEILKVQDRDHTLMYDHIYPKQGIHKDQLYKLDQNKVRVPNSHYADHDINGVWYLYGPDGAVVDTLDDQYFDAGDIAYILSRLDVSISSQEECNIYESIYNLTRSVGNPISEIRESYIWKVLFSDDEVRDFIGKSNNALKQQVKDYCKDNEVEVINLLNVKHVRDDREMDQEYLQSIEEDLTGYELSWYEKTRGNRSIIKSKIFRNFNNLENFKSSISRSPKFIKFASITEPDGTSYLTEDGDKNDYFIATSRTGRYNLYRNSEDGTLRVYDTKTFKYVNTDISSEEDFDAWRDQ